MFCNNCGAKMEEGMMFCIECGQKVEDIPEQNEDATVLLVEDDKTIIYEKSDNKKETKEPVNCDLKNDNQQKENEDESVKEEIISAQRMQVSAPIEPSKIKYCHNCGSANAESDAFCYACGIAFDGKKASKNKGKKSAKIPGFILPVAAILILVCAAVFLFGGNSKKNALIYLKDNEIMQSLKGENYIIGDSAHEDRENSYFNNAIEYATKLSSDGKLIFYPQDYEDGMYDLYYKNVNDTKSKGIKIDSEVYEYVILDNNKVVYTKDDSENKLYISDLTDKEKIASEVAFFRVSKDQKKVFWRSEDDDKMYVCDLSLKEDKVKLDSEVSSIVYVSEDLNDIVYTKDDTLYYIADCGEKVKIDSDVYDWSYIVPGDKAEIYYYVEEDDLSFTAGDFIDDDYAQEDAAITEPNIADYQTVEIKPSYWGDRETVVTSDEYYDLLEKYNEKLYRDELREEMAEDSDLEKGYTLYRYVVGEESVKLDSGMLEACWGSTNVYLYQKLNMDKIEKIKMSDLLECDADYEMEEMFEKSLKTGLETYLVKNGTAVVLDIDYEEYEFSGSVQADNADKSECYITLTELIDDESDDSASVSLFKINYAGTDISMELVTDEYSNMEVVMGGNVYYITEAKEGVGELYCNGEKIDSDVDCYSVEALANGKGILYLTDPDDEYSEGTLNVYTSGEAIRIADDVCAYDSNESGKVAYISDYNFEKYRGDLKVFNGKNSELIDSDVTGILYY